MTTPDPRLRDGIAMEGERAAPPLQPSEVRIGLAIPLVAVVFLFAKQFYPGPTAAHEILGISSGLAAMYSFYLIRALRKWRSHAALTVFMLVTVAYAGVFLYLAIEQPHRLIPWFLNPALLVFFPLLAAFVHPPSKLLAIE